MAKVRNTYLHRGIFFLEFLKKCFSRITLTMVFFKIMKVELHYREFFVWREKKKKNSILRRMLLDRIPREDAQLNFATALCKRRKIRYAGRRSIDGSSRLVSEGQSSLKLENGFTGQDPLSTPRVLWRVQTRTNTRRSYQNFLILSSTWHHHHTYRPFNLQLRFKLARLPRGLSPWSLRLVMNTECIV